MFLGNEYRIQGVLRLILKSNEKRKEEVKDGGIWIEAKKIKKRETPERDLTGKDISCFTFLSR
jgi:hypothetical protein